MTSDYEVCVEVLEYLDDLATRYDAWQRSHPGAEPVDIEAVTVARGVARRLLAAELAGELYGVGRFTELREAIAAIEINKLLYLTDNFGTGGIRRSPEVDAKYAIRPVEE